MSTLELAPTRQLVSWIFATFAGGALALLLFLARQKYLPSNEPEFFLFIDFGVLLIGAVCALLLGAQRTSIHLVVSNSPEVVRTNTWFGRFAQVRRTPLLDIAWARVTYADEMLLSVEVGTYAHQTTSVVCLPYSDTNIPLAKQLCSKVAAALHIEDKGYLQPY